MKHVVMTSGGVGSWAAARRVAEIHGRDNLVLLFADTLIESPDLYTFLDDVGRDLDVPVTRIADGRTIWHVFLDERYLGNTRVDPCSYHLKRKLMRSWVEDHCDPGQTVCYLGIDWSEDHRMKDAAVYWDPWRVEAPLLARPWLDKNQMLEQARQAGIRIPSLYNEGFPHNNCGGGCVKAGQGQFKLLLEKRPRTYAVWEHNEQVVRDHLGKNVAILRDRRGGKTRPLPLREFRTRVQGGQLVPDELEFGGCACGTGGERADARVVSLGLPGRTPCAITGTVDCDCRDRLVG
jgi:hypothetical protein